MQHSVCQAMSIAEIVMPGTRLIRVLFLFTSYNVCSLVVNMFGMFCVCGRQLRGKGCPISHFNESQISEYKNVM